MGQATPGTHRRLRCDHQPTGTVARPECVDNAARWVAEQTGHLWVYREFGPQVRSDRAVGDVS